MSSNSVAAIILAAGKGTRMKARLHKVLHPLGGHPMLGHILSTLEPLNPERRVVIVGSGRDQIETFLGGTAQTALQEPQLGTGHALLQARAALQGFAGDVLILYGDVPLIRGETFEALINARRTGGPSGKVPAIAVLGFEAADPGAYGRLKLDADGSLEKIVEFKDASEDERAITLCNSGVMAVDGAVLFDLLDNVDNSNAKGEYYLTDIVEIARGKGLMTAVITGEEEEVMGVNSQAELAAAEAVFQSRMRAQAMEGGVTLIAPETVYFSHDTKIAPNVLIEPNVWFGPGVSVDEGAMIHGFSHIEGATIGQGVSVGPFARLRPGADLKDGSKVGNFVEVKKSTLEEGAKVNHLTYIGDARVGAKANVGAGTITCNYDGFNKARTDIGAGAFIGSNSSLVAPVTIGDGAIVGAGSVVTRNVDGDALGVTRADQKEIKGWAAKFRARQLAKKQSEKK